MTLKLLITGNKFVFYEEKHESPLEIPKVSDRNEYVTIYAEGKAFHVKQESKIPALAGFPASVRHLSREGLEELAQIHIRIRIPQNIVRTASLIGFLIIEFIYLIVFQTSEFVQYTFAVSLISILQNYDYVTINITAYGFIITPSSYSEHISAILQKAAAPHVIELPNGKKIAALVVLSNGLILTKAIEDVTLAEIKAAAEAFVIAKAEAGAFTIITTKEFRELAFTGGTALFSVKLMIARIIFAVAGITLPI